MNNIRYNLNTNIINYSLSLSYPKQQNKKYKEIITDAIRSIQYPFDGFWNDIDYTWEQLQQFNYELQSPISKLDILMYDL